MKIVIPILALSTLIASSVSCWSASGLSGNLEVKMEVGAGCSVKVGGGGVLDFGNHDRVTEDIRIQGSIEVKCNRGTKYNVGLERGLNYSSTNRTRRMKSESGSLIVYELYKDSAYKDIWGNAGMTGSNNTGFNAEYLQTLYQKEQSYSPALTGLFANGSVRSFTVYGRVLKSDAMSAPPGRYSDTVRVMVSY